MNIYFNIASPAPGAFIIALHFKGRDKPILEMDLKIDDLLEKQKDHQASLELEYVQLNVPKVLTLFNKVCRFILNSGTCGLNCRAQLFSKRR